MKKLYFVILTIGVSVASVGYCQTDSIIKKGYTNIATLKVDYTTYNFEGGDISYYSCPDCTMDSIPFSIDYDPPGDFGGITFKLSSSDTVFDATIIWSGTGKVQYPEKFDTLSPFVDTNLLISKPNDLRSVDVHGFSIFDTTYLDRIDSAWNAIDSLKITEIFEGKGYKALVYLYAPRVGAFDPNVAKWIIFLYHVDDLTTSINNHDNEEPQFKYFPNPTNGIVNLDLSQHTNVLLTLRDITGKIVYKRSNISDRLYQFKVNQAPGVYFLTLSNDKINQTYKLVKN